MAFNTAEPSPSDLRTNNHASASDQPFIGLDGPCFPISRCLGRLTGPISSLLDRNLAFLQHFSLLTHRPMTGVYRSSCVDLIRSSQAIDPARPASHAQRL